MGRLLSELRRRNRVGGGRCVVLVGLGSGIMMAECSLRGAGAA